MIKTVAENATVLLIEHNMSVVMALAQSITVLDGGKILAEGTVKATCPQVLSSFQSYHSIGRVYYPSTVSCEWFKP